MVIANNTYLKQQLSWCQFWIIWYC